MVNLCIKQKFFLLITATTVAIIAQNPPPPRFIPENQPQCGTFFGGDCPQFSNPDNIQSLVPDGLTPVAVFPPFATPRRVPAVAVIFKEAPGTLPGVNTGRKKRDLGYCEPPSALDKFLLNVRCLGPRLTQKFGRKPTPVHHGKKQIIDLYNYIKTHMSIHLLCHWRNPVPPIPLYFQSCGFITKCQK